MRANLAWCAVAISTGACNADNAPLPAWIPADAIDEIEIAQPGAEVPATEHLRVVTYNVLMGIEVEELAAYVAQSPELGPADLWFIQEAEAPREGVSDAARLAARLGMGHVYVPVTEQEDSESGTEGIAILSRFPMRDVEVMFLRDLSELELIPSSPAAMAVTVDVEGGELRVIDVHLDVGLNLPERILQLRPAVLKQPSRVVIGGDFNTNDYVWAASTAPLLPIDAVADTSQAEAVDDYMRDIAYDTPTDSFGSTWDGPIEDLRLDSVFTRGLEPGNGAVDRELDLSDHWPVWLDIDTR